MTNSPHAALAAAMSEAPDLLPSEWAPTRELTRDEMTRVIRALWVVGHIDPHALTEVPASDSGSDEDLAAEDARAALQPIIAGILPGHTEIAEEILDEVVALMMQRTIQEAENWKLLSDSNAAFQRTLDAQEKNGPPA